MADNLYSMLTSVNMGNQNCHLVFSISVATAIIPQELKGKSYFAGDKKTVQKICEMTMQRADTFQCS